MAADNKYLLIKWHLCCHYLNICEQMSQTTERSTLSLWKWLFQCYPGSHIKDDHITCYIWLHPQFNPFHYSSTITAPKLANIPVSISIGSKSTNLQWLYSNPKWTSNQFLRRIAERCQSVFETCPLFAEVDEVRLCQLLKLVNMQYVMQHDCSILYSLGVNFKAVLQRLAYLQTASCMCARALDSYKQVESRLMKGIILQEYENYAECMAL